ncbi:hypothetical protein GCM10010254_58040 [Streptomyces chromofuscus]|nr:hypothetical protein GCM10010254_58040 [Streptomyces chromofuscus]
MPSAPTFQQLHLLLLDAGVRSSASNPKRDRRAGELTALVTLSVPVSDEARERGGRFVLNAPCPDCGDTRQVWALWAVDVDADWYEEGHGPCSLCGGAA